MSRVHRQRRARFSPATIACATVASLVVATASCSDSTGPVEPRDVVGRYLLARIDGRSGPWPTAWPPTARDTFFIVADTLETRDDGTFTRTVARRAGSAGATFTDRRGGWWSLSDDRRTLNTSYAGNRSTFTDALSIQAGGRRLLRDVGFTDPLTPGRVYEYVRRMP